MDFVVAVQTDKGNIKKNNQDSVSVQIADSYKGRSAMAVLCDGMGGLSKGELASAVVTREFNKWFSNKFPLWLESEKWEEISSDWAVIIKEANKKLNYYGQKNGVNLGTTVTAVLFFKGKYIYIHVGDSRFYCLKDNINQITEDQTLICREIKEGKITPEQAVTDPRRNVLLQCVGASKDVKPEIGYGNVTSGSTYLLCSDGFRHEVTHEEIFDRLNPRYIVTEEQLGERTREIIETVKSRHERDNITAALIHITD